MVITNILSKSMTLHERCFAVIPFISSNYKEIACNIQMHVCCCYQFSLEFIRISDNSQPVPMKSINCLKCCIYPVFFWFMCVIITYWQGHKVSKTSIDHVFRIFNQDWLNTVGFRNYMPRFSTHLALFQIWVWASKLWTGWHWLKLCVVYVMLSK